MTKLSWYYIWAEISQKCIALTENHTGEPVHRVVHFTHTERESKNPWRQLPSLLSNLDFKEKFQGIWSIKTSYFPPQSLFIGATNPALPDTGAISQSILRKVTNHLTVGIWFHNVEAEKDRGVYEHVSFLGWIFALKCWHWGCSPPICVHSTSVGNNCLLPPSLAVGLSEHGLRKELRRQAVPWFLSKASFRFLWAHGLVLQLTIDKVILQICSKGRT